MSSTKVKFTIEAHNKALTFEVVPRTECPIKDEEPCTDCRHFKARKVGHTCITVILGEVQGEGGSTGAITEKAWGGAGA